jgi:hypothetical protein
LIAELAERASGYQRWSPDVTAPQWNRDPFTFRAFKLAVVKLLDALEPEGEIRPPSIPEPFGGSVRDYKTPKILAGYVARNTLENLFNPEPLNVSYEAYIQEVGVSGTREDGTFGPVPVPEQALEVFRKMDKARKREFYGMSDARRDLEIKPRGYAS